MIQYVGSINIILPHALYDRTSQLRVVYAPGLPICVGANGQSLFTELNRICCLILIRMKKIEKNPLITSSHAYI